MCRYAEYGPYKCHFACFYCRKMFRRAPDADLVRPVAMGEERVAHCAECGAEMVDLGLDFKAPRQRDREQWEKVELLYRHGYTFHSCGCSGPGPRPNRLKEVPVFLVEQERERREWLRRQRLAAEAELRDRRRKQRERLRRTRVLERQARALMRDGEPVAT